MPTKKVSLSLPAELLGRIDQQGPRSPIVARNLLRLEEIYAATATKLRSQFSTEELQAVAEAIRPMLNAFGYLPKQWIAVASETPDLVDLRERLRSLDTVERLTLADAIERADGEVSL